MRFSGYRAQIVLHRMRAAAAFAHQLPQVAKAGEHECFDATEHDIE